MAKVGWGAVALCVALASGAATADQTRPEPRPAPVAQGDAVGQGGADALVRPRARPAIAQVGRAAPIAPLGLERSLVPQARPQDLPVTDVLPVRNAGIAPRRGSICGDPRLQGARIAPIVGKVPGCGVAEPVRLTGIDGVALSRPAIMDCPTAVALRDWIDTGVRPAVGRKGGGLAALEVAAHYVCRTRNHKPGAKISEHGKGRAVDISALVLADGTRISVLQDWGQGRGGTILRAAHGAACGPFGTVLGPEADRYHRDHFHFDTASYRSGSYCR